MASRRGQVNRSRRTSQNLLESDSTLLEGQRGVVGLVEGQQIEGDEASGSLLREQLDPAGRGMDTLLQYLEFEPVSDHDDDLPIDDTAFRQVLFDRLNHFGEIPRHRPLVARADLYLITIPEDDRPEAVPLRLVREIAGGNL